MQGALRWPNYPTYMSE